MRQTSLLEATWLLVKDGNDVGRDLYQRHYSRKRKAPGRKESLLFVAPGEKMVLITPTADAVFVWRRGFDYGGQKGVNCTIFRNEGQAKSSELILAAEAFAWERWPGERLYTYVNPGKVRKKRDPGRCFLKAGWRHAGWTKRGLRILEKEAGWETPR